MNKKSLNGKTFLKRFLRTAPLSHALWRSVEALSFSSVIMKKPVLDIGCGFGEFAGVVFDKIEMGIDINDREIKDALQGKKYKKVRWADARELPFKDASYETVLSVSTLEHIENVEKVIQEVHRILRRDGTFIFSVPTSTLYRSLLIPALLSSIGLEHLSEKYITLHKEAFKHVTIKPKKWWEKTLKNSGFRIIREEGTISKSLLWAHEFFLCSAFPSQIWKLLFGRRLIASVGIRSFFLPFFFNHLIKIEEKSDINIFFVVKKI
jgi:ubiquinone/menaquinone biosynthesis C-methylase UbiE